MVYTHYGGIQKEKRSKLTYALIALVLAVALASFVTIQSVMASSTVVVRPSNSAAQGWSTADTRPGGSVNYMADSSSPFGQSALQLTTDATNTAKAQYLKGTILPLDEVTALAYSTKQNSASFVAGLPSFQLLIDVDGNTSDGGVGFTTLVYEPYNVLGNGAVLNGTWQQWDVDAGTFWSSRTVGGLTAGAGGPPFYSIADVLVLNPNAVVIGFGVNVGTYNPSYNVETDGIVFNDTTYDFENDVVLANKDECKKNGWSNSTNPLFKNQGDCVSFFATGGRNQANGQ